MKILIIKNLILFDSCLAFDLEQQFLMQGFLRLGLRMNCDTDYKNVFTKIKKTSSILVKFDS